MGPVRPVAAYASLCGTAGMLRGVTGASASAKRIERSAETLDEELSDRETGRGRGGGSAGVLLYGRHWGAGTAERAERHWARRLWRRGRYVQGLVGECFKAPRDALERGQCQRRPCPVRDDLQRPPRRLLPARPGARLGCVRTGLPPMSHARTDRTRYVSLTLVAEMGYGNRPLRAAVRGFGDHAFPAAPRREARHCWSDP